jgi:hypothetical protein
VKWRWLKSNRWISRRNVPGHGQQAEAEREKRAKVIPAEGELLASEKLAQAAAVIGQPVAIQLRYLQTLTEIGVEKNTTVSRFPWISFKD